MDLQVETASSYPRGARTLEWPGTPRSLSCPGPAFPSARVSGGRRSWQQALPPEGKLARDLAEPAEPWLGPGRAAGRPP